MHRNKPDVWEVCSKVSKMISKPKRKNKKIVYDEEGNKVMEQVSVTEGKCGNCGKCMCRNACTLAGHYNACVGKLVFDDAGYYIRTNDKKRSLSSLSPNKSSSPIPKRRRLNSMNDEDEDEDEDEEVDNIIQSARHQSLQTPNTYKRYKQLLIEESLVLRKWGNEKQKIMDKLLGLWIIDGIGINYKSFESVYCKLLFRFNNPQCRVPDRKKIKNILLGIKKDLKSIVDNDMKRAGSCQIAMDGSNDKQEPLVHILALLPEPRLILQKRHQWKKENAPQLYSDFKEASKYGERNGCKTSSGMGDNCK